MRKIADQTLASTHIDARGERLSKSFLDHYCEKMGGRRFPLHQQHDMSKPTAGYFENLRVVPDAEEAGDWRLIADVCIDEAQIENPVGGFSISGKEMLRESPTATALFYVPFPHYNDAEFIAALTADPDLGVGKWIKKGIEDYAWGAVFGSTIAFLLTPIWDDIYKRKVAPRMDALLARYLPALHARGLSAEIVQMVICRDSEVEVRLIPTKGKEAICLHSESVFQGLQVVVAFLQSDSRASAVGVTRIVVFYNDGANRYALHRIEYSDGQVDHVA